ncbi:glycosyltransferase [Ameyamaea chiangmaiensis NBRC 103196]|uniref:Glycosyltransferase family 4 protein n=1 Tax=Ameyamaea chiangmaiensis TaxID=442969 RepID=A0A850P9Q8_9PROT|nr:glycosyltransferase family 1 protein [Ameyamaea chiangmaiensis]MBS4076402.1 glycosyltransferase family 4 protein [Ameyamaea chiangmaiensis]NVN40648.1 glycosyltransferase family 4 protein [Ameyamaea chiangmaiensis]GBQ63429.1 glycosyltransferase [Ameyamaea chiangmaiensis NBRC 103196]
MADQTVARIGVDGFNLALERGTGVATYARTLTRALERMGHPVDMLYGLDIPTGSDPALREVRFFDRLEQPPGKRPAPFSKRWIRERRADLHAPAPQEITLTGRVDSRPFADRLPAFTRLFNADGLFQRAARHFRRTGRLTRLRMDTPPAIMHWTYPLPVMIEGAANIYTIHDVVPLRLPYTTLDDKPYYYRLMNTICAQADALCTVSEASRRDIVSFFPSSDGKLHNTYQSFSPSPVAMERSDAECKAEIDADFGLLPQSYFLFFGSLEPKKNIGRLIEAFLASGCARKLVLVGAMAWKSERELRYLDRGIAAGRIVMIDYLPERTLFALLRMARALLFPSLSEGFGLPVLEAMSCGVPALVSAEGALPEVSGDAALQTDAYDVDAIARAIRRLDADDALCDGLAAAGRGQAARFDMTSYCQRLAGLYHSVLASAPTTKA